MYSGHKTRANEVSWSTWETLLWLLNNKVMRWIICDVALRFETEYKSKQYPNTFRVTYVTRFTPKSMFSNANNYVQSDFIVR